MSETVGLIGLGLVGTALAERLLSHGFGVAGYDIDDAKNNHLVTMEAGPPQGRPTWREAAGASSSRF